MYEDKDIFSYVDTYDYDAIGKYVTLPRRHKKYSYSNKWTEITTSQLVDL